MIRYLSESCTCTAELIDGPFGQVPVATEPDSYCRQHFPKNHALREEKARTGYEAKTAEAIARNPWMASTLPSWDSLREPGKTIWRHWAVAEFWNGGFDDGTAGTPQEPVELPAVDHSHDQF